MKAKKKNFFLNSRYEDQMKRIEAAAKLSSTGGNARASALSSKERSSIASKAAKARWNAPK